MNESCERTRQLIDQYYEHDVPTRASKITSDDSVKAARIRFHVMNDKRRVNCLDCLSYAAKKRDECHGSDIDESVRAIRAGKKKKHRKSLRLRSFASDGG